MLDIEHVSKDYFGLPVLSDINLHIGEHEIVAIVGPSGCGKSTLLNIIAAINGEYRGTITTQARKIGYVFQEDRLLPWLNVYENVAIVRKKEDRARIREVIQKVHLDGFEKYYPAQLSGGMKQRCGIARALYYGSELLLMDEPFKSLDPGLRCEMLENLLEILKNEKGSVLFVTHDVDEALSIADRIVIFSRRPGRILEEITLPETQNLRDVLRKENLKLKHWIMGRLSME